MHRLLALTLAVACSWLGWLLGSQISTATGFIVSFVGVGVGLYIGKRISLYYFG
jgi:hypothetical protein